MRYSEAQAFLNSFINYELVKPEQFPRHFHLKRVSKLLELLGNPHRQFQSIHIAGSKGKGSTAIMTAEVLNQAGYKTGLYSSPHIFDYHERIRVLGKTDCENHLFKDGITDDEFAECLTDMRPAIEEVAQDASLGRLSFFEIFTALGFYYFAKNNIQWAVIETGLGGRLDATNVVESSVAVITSIDYEHTHVLGDTLSEIAREKAGIIKSSGQWVVLAAQQSEATAEVLKQCGQTKSPVIHPDELVSYELADKTLLGQRLAVHELENDYNIFLPLVGDYQIVNLKSVIGVVHALRKNGMTIDNAALEKGIAQTAWPIRFEVMSQNPTIILDAAHTIESLKNLSQTIQEYIPQKEVLFVLGFSTDKDIKKLCGQLQNCNADVIFTKANHPRAKDLKGEDMSGYFQSVQYAPTVDEALGMAKKILSDRILVVAGSIFVASEARQIILKDKDYVSV